MSRIASISPPGGAPGPGFEEPFEMLHACHERVERMLALLAKLRTHLRNHGADDQARQAARDVMRYFDHAAPQHHRDEELHVFPALIGLGDGDLAQLVARLQGEHQQMELRWASARSALDAVESGSRPQLDAADEIALDAFAALYVGHIRAEEEVAYPNAANAMDRARVELMSRDMMARRGVR